MLQDSFNHRRQYLRQELVTLADIAGGHFHHRSLQDRLRQLSLALAGSEIEPSAPLLPKGEGVPAFSSQEVSKIVASTELLIQADPSPADSWAAKATAALAEFSELLRRQQAARLKGLYVIADPEAAGSRDLTGLIAAALKGGAKAVQLRDKHSDKGDQLPLAKTLAQLCRDHDALFFINDHADLAVAADADGIHAGQHDLPVDEVRKTLLPHQLVGTSNALVDEAHASITMGADYIAVGAMFPTKTKLNTRPAGVETLQVARQLTDLPLVAIGGINATNVAEVVEAGADAICVTSAVLAAKNPEAAASELADLIERTHQAMRRL